LRGDENAEKRMRVVQVCSEPSGIFRYGDDWFRPVWPVGCEHAGKHNLGGGFIKRLGFLLWSINHRLRVN
jgi:hypothetical protein